MFHGTDSGIKISWSRSLELYLVRLNLTGLSLAGPVGRIDSLDIITIILHLQRRLLVQPPQKKR